MLFNQLDPVTGLPIAGTSCMDPVTGVPTGPPCTILALSDMTGGGIPPGGTTTRYAPGSPFTFHGHTDVKETAFYLQDSITKGSWAFNLGVRGDIYDGFVKDGQAQRAGVMLLIINADSEAKQLDDGIGNTFVSRWEGKFRSLLIDFQADNIFFCGGNGIPVWTYSAGTSLLRERMLIRT